MFEYIKENIERLEEVISTAAKKAGRSRSDITLVAVSKTFGNDITRAVIESGLCEIGEARIQEAEPKIKTLGNICRWHMIGHVQTNKAAKTVALFDMIQSLDSIKLAGEINRRAADLNKKIDCLIEINSSGEESKHGFALEETLEAIQEIAGMENINARGLMTIGPLTTDEELIRIAFRKTKELYERGREIRGGNFDILSMGMSADFVLAIEEGSTMIRIGTAIFGKRAKRRTK